MRLRAVAGHALNRLDDVRPWRVLDRPVFIIAGPRTGSTLLFDLLTPHPELRSWPFEALGAYERVRPPDHPIDLGHRWPASYATPQRRRALARELYLGRLRARRQEGLPVGRLERLALRRIRLLEKSPPTILRLEALAGMFPDARFVVLHRDAPSTIASLLEVWETPGPTHATVQVVDRAYDWTMLVPAGWLALAEAPLPERAAFQWASMAECAARAVAAVAADRCLVLRYEELVADTQGVLRRVLDFCDLSHAPEVLAATAAGAERGRTSLSPVRADKWRDRAADIEPLLPSLAPLRRRLGYEA